MSAYYICNRCNAVFSEDEAATESFFHNEVRPTFTENFIACPHCLSTDYEDAAYCYRCKRPMRWKKLRGGYYCEECLKDIRNRYHESRFVNENLDEFAEFMHEARSKNHADEQDEKDLM